MNDEASPPAQVNALPEAIQAGGREHRPPVATPRWVWLILILVSALLVAGTAGLLAHVGGNSIPTAVLTAGAAFAGTVLLLLAVAYFLEGK
jgi:hypothetical protein